MTLSKPAQSLRALLAVERDDSGGDRISLDAAIRSRLGLGLRSDEARVLALKILGVDSAAWARAERVIRIDQLADIGGRFDALADGLNRLAERPLTGRLVVETLGITNQERLRWTKDGRLRQSGSASIRRNHVVTIQTYDPDRVATISPQTIQSWREVDSPVRVSVKK